MHLSLNHRGESDGHGCSHGFVVATRGRILGKSCRTWPKTTSRATAMTEADFEKCLSRGNLEFIRIVETLGIAPVDLLPMHLGRVPRVLVISDNRQ